MIVSSTEMAKGVSDSSNREQPGSAAFCPIGQPKRGTVIGVVALVIAMGRRCRFESISVSSTTRMGKVYVKV